MHRVYILYHWEDVIMPTFIKYQMVFNIHTIHAAQKGGLPKYKHLFCGSIVFCVCTILYRIIFVEDTHLVLTNYIILYYYVSYK